MYVWWLTGSGHTSLDGEGARRAGGRWNSPGVPVVYAAAHLSLAVLELLAQVRPERVPDDLVALEIEVPDNLAITSVQPNELPDDWRANPPEPGTQQLGDAWAARRDTPVLAVPSSVVPRERNFLLNVLHPDAVQWQVMTVEPFQFDARLFRVVEQT